MEKHPDVPSPTRSGTGPAEEMRSTAWHARPADEICGQLGVGPEGLGADDAARRLMSVGANQLAPVRPKSALRRLLAQFANVLIYVLIAAGAVTAALGYWIDSGVIFAVVLINAAIGFIQEGRAEGALDAIRDLLSPNAMVTRDGKRLTIPAERLVPGDIVTIQPGDKVPADLRLLRARNLRIQEAILTGESAPVQKAGAPVPEDAPLGDRASMAFSGTLVTAGQGTGVVVATARATEIGQISTLMASVSPLTTPLLRQMSRFARWLTAAILLLAGATFAIGAFGHDRNAPEMFLAAVGLAVAAIPEGLPAIMTITLAIGVERMAKRNAIIRRLPAVETLGSVSVICSDKTGTFTRNEMTVESLAASRHVYTVTGEGYDPAGNFLIDGRAVRPEERSPLQALALGALLCSDATLRHEAGEWRIDGDPMEGALVVVGAKAGLDPDFARKTWPRTDEIPFESEHRFMATLHHDHAHQGVVYVKGAPERILEMCARQRDGEGEIPLDHASWQRQTEEMVAEGQRVLALATRPTRAEHRVLSFSDIDRDLTFLGLFGLGDAPREEAIEAVARCRAAGIRVKMITGDHAGTAKAVAARLGLENAGHALTGADLDALPETALAPQAAHVDVFARTSPAHKLKLVEALQAQGEVVAMTGDGVNDAPALKRADVGIAMGRKGAEAAKEAAEMVLADDNFASIVHAVEEGRTVYDNLKKALLFILPTNGGEAFAIVAAVSFGMMLPVTAAQILWVNMITAVTLALALAFEPAENDVMRRPPREADEPLLSAFLAWRIVVVSLLLVLGVFGVFRWLRLSGADIETARTASVNMLVMFEVFYLFNVRRLDAWSPALTFGREARIAWLAVGAVLVFQALFTYAPFMQVLFHTKPLPARILGVILAISAALFAVIEIEKALVRRASARRSTAGAAVSARRSLPRPH